MITLYEEQRQGAIAKTIEHSRAPLEKCLEAIRRMDGFACSLVTIQYEDNTIMVGGGSSEFIVTVETRAAIRNLIGTLGEGDDFVEITVGGQACEYPRMYIVSLKLVESAILQLLTNASVELEWETIEK